MEMVKCVAPISVYCSRALANYFPSSKNYTLLSSFCFFLSRNANVKGFSNTVFCFVHIHCEIITVDNVVKMIIWHLYLLMREGEDISDRIGAGVPRSSVKRF